MAVFATFYYFICNIFLFLSFREEIQYLSGVPRIIPNSLTEINNYTSTSYNAVTFSYKQHPFFLVSLSFHETHRWGGAPPYDEEQCLSSTRAMAPFCSRVCAALLSCHTRLRMSSGMSPRWRTSPVLRAGVRPHTCTRGPHALPRLCTGTRTVPTGALRRSRPRRPAMYALFPVVTS